MDWQVVVLILGLAAMFTAMFITSAITTAMKEKSERDFFKTRESYDDR